MQRHYFIRWMASGVAGAASAIGVLGFLYLINSGSGFAGTTAALDFGWVVPLLTGVITGAVAWALLALRGDTEQDQDVELHRCAFCGGTVMVDWRLCPHCGERFR